MLVLSALVVLTTMATEFAYNTNVSYHLAQNERDRLKAQYLALSAYRFMLVELKFDKVFRTIVEKQNLGQYLGAAASAPLCQQFPLSTGLIRAVFLGGAEGAAEGTAAPEGETAPPPVPEDIARSVSIAQKEGATEFLDFDGDFEGECVDESSKINLNAFASWKPDKVIEGKLNDYDQYKEFLTKYWSDLAYKDLFEKAGVKPEDAARNIADWVDTNERINEMGGGMSGPEEIVYERRGLKYPLRNDKFVTPDEVYLVEGVVDDWFFPLEKRFTIYGDEKVDVCAAQTDVIMALIRRYVESKPELPPMNWSDPELQTKFITAIQNGCAMGGTGDQMKQNVSQALTTAIAEITGTSLTPETPAGGTTPPVTPPAGAAGAADTGFGKYIATDRRFFSLRLTGLVGDTVVTIRTVLDVGDTDPKKWKVLYWRVY